MAKLLQISPLAQQDLEDIFYYGVSSFGETKAMIFLERLEKNFNHICSFDIGTPCFDVLPNLFHFNVEKYVIFFFRSENKIEIVRILHSSRDALDYF